MALAAVVGAGGLHVFRPQSPVGVSSGALAKPSSVPAPAVEPVPIAPVSHPPAAVPLPTDRASVPTAPSVSSSASSAPRKKRAPRVAIASATVPAPSVVAAPDATAHVSPGRSEEIERLIQQRR